MKRTSYQLGRVVCGPRKRGPDAWIFRYMEDGVQKAEHLGTTIQCKTKAPARKEAGRRSTEINERVDGIMVSGLCDRLKLEGEKAGELRPHLIDIGISPDRHQLLSRGRPAISGIISRTSTIGRKES